MQDKITGLGLSFDDVLIIPQKTPVRSRREINIRTKLTKNISLSIPIISSNMSSVTEARMAIAMAREGGLGVIHRFMSVKREAEEIRKVKRSEALLIENPYTIQPEASINQAKELMKTKNVNGLLVVEGRKLVGIITSRDLRFTNEQTIGMVKEFMTKDVITLPKGGSIQQAKQLMQAHRIEKLPVVDDKGFVVGLITAKDVKNKEARPFSSVDKKGRLLVGASLGVKKISEERAKACAEAGADLFVIDVAHGHADYVVKKIKELKKDYDLPVIAGNVATYEGALELGQAGADCIKVGVGPGSVCTTRIVTGAGVPQITAIMNASRACEELGITCMADGGIKCSGDITKALVAGADTVMIGSLLAGTDEAVGFTFIKNNQKYKMYGGMSSFEVQVNRLNQEDQTYLRKLENIISEGIQSIRPYQGSVREVLNKLLGGLRSGMSYAGAKDIPSLKKATFIRITAQGYKESTAHNSQI